jgi:methionyl-tRNA formyltransferase
VQERDDVQVVAVCDSGRRKPIPVLYSMFRKIAVAGLMRLFEPDSQVFLKRLAFSNLHNVARRFRLKVVIPPERNINHSEFVQYLRGNLRPSIGLSFGCLQIFGKKLLSVFDQAVNYHNGLLPEYKGLGATRWSIFHGEPQSGFTFHLMNERIDDGDILIQGAVPLAPNANPLEVEFRKTLKAANYVEDVINRSREPDAGRPQRGTVSYFGKKELKNITTIYHPSAYACAELQRRLRCFQVLYFPIRGRMYEVTKIREVDRCRPGRHEFCFFTSDERPVELHRFLHMPFPLYRIYRLMRRVELE